MPNSADPCTIKEMRRVFVTDSAIQTEQLGRNIGQTLKGGEVIELVGDVGSGKTTFVRGLAQGLGAKDQVSSPTFTVCNRYHGRKLIHHCDFYRLYDDSLIQQELSELVDGEAVVILEWAEEVSDAMPSDRITISISPLSETSRQFILETVDAHGYITW